MPASFCHHGVRDRESLPVDVLKEIQDCENRTRSAEGRQALQAITRSRGQWLSRFYDNFVGMFLLAHGKLPSGAYSSPLPKISQVFLKSVEKLRRNRLTIHFERPVRVDTALMHSDIMEPMSSKYRHAVEGGITPKTGSMDIHGSAIGEIAAIHASGREMRQKEISYMQEYLGYFLSGRESAELGLSRATHQRLLSRVADKDAHKQITYAARDFLFGPGNLDLYAGLILTEVETLAQSRPEEVVKRIRNEEIFCWAAVEVIAALCVTPWEHGWQEWCKFLRERDKLRARQAAGVGFGRP